jgi:aryl-alcohol dehydrogenase-like predicted oxidoreductase/histidinol phosphatase-like enzyme/predicted kinase
MTTGKSIGIGCMRLSTDPDRDERRAIAVLHAAFEAGISFLDTADAYCRDASEAGHNERLIATALGSWPGDRSRILIATKGGLTRPQGAWVADGRARHLVAACEASRRALGVECVDLYQLHVPDPRTPLSTSIRALDSLKREGYIQRIGLCNVNVGQIEEARRVTEIDSVQVELSVWDDSSILSGVVAYCLAHDIRLIAHRPLGGAKRQRRTAEDPVLVQIAANHGSTPFEIALAYLEDISPLVTTIPGPTRAETARSIARAHRIILTGEDRSRLDARFLSFKETRVPASVVQHGSARSDGEVVLVMGLPGAGKSTFARTLTDQGYERLNRDQMGGTLEGLLPALERSILSGSSRLVADNTYVSRRSRASVIQTARRHGLRVRCVWLSTSLEDAQVNAVERIVARYGRLLTPEEMRKARKRDVAAFGPGVQFRYQRELEPPDPAEGFSRIDVVPFERQRDPTRSGRALIVWCDGVLLGSRSGQRTPESPEDLELFDERVEMLRGYQSDGWTLLGMSWQPEIASDTRIPAQIDAVFNRMRELTGLAMDVEYCPHAAGPPVCWCRKPLPGLGVLFIRRHQLDPVSCIYIGNGVQDPGFARRLGFQYRDANEFFDRRSIFCNRRFHPKSSTDEIQK